MIQRLLHNFTVHFVTFKYGLRQSTQPNITPFE